MILITLGSQKFQFNRLLEEIDRLIELNIIKEEVYAQVGYSDYIPKNYKYTNFLNRNELLNLVNKTDKIITHGGTGAIVSALKNKKKVIAIPRLLKYEEHIDNHQVEIVELFDKMNMIMSVIEITELENALKKIDLIQFKPFISNTENVINSIEKYINS